MGTTVFNPSLPPTSWSTMRTREAVIRSWLALPRPTVFDPYDPIMLYAN